MIRIVVNIGLSLLASAIGLVVAAAVLDDMALEPAGFVIAVGIFTLAQVILRPLITKMALQNAPALGGSSALISTLAALVITVLVSDSLSIDGATTWVLATVIVWAASLLGAVLLPWLLLKRRREGTSEGKGKGNAGGTTTWG